jgi:hypothetical protein
VVAAGVAIIEVAKTRIALLQCEIILIFTNYTK